MITGILIFIATLLIMVTFHEFGHYITARKFGIKVEEFFVGFGPRLFSRWRGETEFGVKAILLGSYVKIAGMNPFQEIPPEELPRTFGAKPAWQRAIVLVAGSFTHFILAIVVFSGLIYITGLPELTTQVEEVATEVGGKPGPAQAAGLQPGDRLVSIEGTRITSWEQVRPLVQPNSGRQLTFVVERNGRNVTLEITPVEGEAVTDPNNPDETEIVGQIGVLPVVETEKGGPVWAVGEGLKTTGTAIWRSVVGTGMIFTSVDDIFGALGGTGEREITEDQPVGLVGTARLAGQATSAGAIASLVSFLGYFIVFVGVINLAPLPPLDGGHLLVLALEKISRRSIDPKKVLPFAGVVLGFLAMLTFALLFLDLARPIVNPFQ
ncbi:MAG TPA: M50 family metallopeptidase [Actinomycetota bacterium]|nr:M50 family metallopeptidase [Actinomycetota bacterium]